MIITNDFTVHLTAVLFICTYISIWTLYVRVCLRGHAHMCACSCYHMPPNRKPWLVMAEWQFMDWVFEVLCGLHRCLKMFYSAYQLKHMNLNILVFLEVKPSFWNGGFPFTIKTERHPSAHKIRWSEFHTNQ